MLTFYLSETLDPNESLVANPANMVPVKMRNWIFGESNSVLLTILKADGTASPVSGNTSYTIKVGVGAPGSTPAFLTTSFNSTGTAWTGFITMTGASVLALFGSATSITAYLQIELIDGSGNAQTYAQLPFKFTLPVIASTSTPTIPSPIFTLIGSDGNTYAETVQVINGIPSVQSVAVTPTGGTQPPLRFEMIGNDGNTYLISINVTNGIPTLQIQ